jgi:homoserine dehydrogenase
MGAQPLRIALLGCGVVGSEVVRLLISQAEDLAARIGAPLELAGVGVRDLSAPRRVPVPEGLLTDDLPALVARPDVDVVVELMGGIEPARSLLVQAIGAGPAS